MSKMSIMVHARLWHRIWHFIDVDCSSDIPPSVSSDFFVHLLDRGKRSIYRAWQATETTCNGTQQACADALSSRVAKNTNAECRMTPSPQNACDLGRKHPLRMEIPSYFHRSGRALNLDVRSRYRHGG